MKKGSGSGVGSTSSEKNNDAEGELVSSEDPALVAADLLDSLPQTYEQRLKHYNFYVSQFTVFDEIPYKYPMSLVTGGAESVLVSPEAIALMTDAERELIKDKQEMMRLKAERKAQMKIEKMARKRWSFMLRRELMKKQKSVVSSLSYKVSTARKTAQLCQKEMKRRIKDTMRQHNKDSVLRARKLSREVMAHWRKVEKDRRDAMKVAEKEELERAKREEEIREAKRQQKKLNFLLKQTEIFSHFISRKIEPGAGGEEEAEEKEGDDAMEVDTAAPQIDLDDDNLDEASITAAATANSAAAMSKQKEMVSAFDQSMEAQRKANLQSLQSEKSGDAEENGQDEDGKFPYRLCECIRF